jgi:hypothetical protein
VLLSLLLLTVVNTGLYTARTQEGEWMRALVMIALDKYGKEIEDQRLEGVRVVFEEPNGVGGYIDFKIEVDGLVVSNQEAGFTIQPVGEAAITITPLGKYD